MKEVAIVQAVVWSNLLAKRILTVWGRCTQFQAKSSVVAVNRKWFSRTVPRDQLVFWVDYHSLRQAQLTTNNFQDGSSKPEVVTLFTYVRQRLNFSIDLYPDVYKVDQS